MSRLEELITELCPDGVGKCTIEDICYISRGRVMSKDYIKENAGEYPVYSSQTENNGQLGLISTYDFDGEYLTWTTDGANAGTVFHRQGKFSVTNVCGLLKIKVPNVMTKYLYYTLSAEAPSYVNQGMGNPKLMSNVMSRIKIFVPPLPVQNEIVRILDNFTELTAELTTELTTELTGRKKQYEYYRDVIINSSNNFDKVKLGQICRVGDGLHSTPKYSDSGSYFFINGNNLNSGTIIIDEKTKKVDEKEYEKYKIAFTDSTILMSINGTIGKLAYYKKEPVILGKSAAYFITNSDKLDCKYLYYYLQSNDAINYFTSNLTGSTILNLGLKALREFEIPLPPLSEQQRIVDILEHFNTLCNDISIKLPVEIKARAKQYEYYRDKLLTFKEFS